MHDAEGIKDGNLLVPSEVGLQQIGSVGLSEHFEAGQDAGAVVGGIHPAWKLNCWLS